MHQCHFFKANLVQFDDQTFDTNSISPLQGSRIVTFHIPGLAETAQPGLGYSAPLGLFNLLMRTRILAIRY